LYIFICHSPLQNSAVDELWIKYWHSFYSLPSHNQEFYLEDDGWLLDAAVAQESLMGVEIDQLEEGWV
jgi:hypothetical protein